MTHVPGSVSALDEASLGAMGSRSGAGSGAALEVALEAVSGTSLASAAGLISESVSEVLRGGSVDPATLLRTVFRGTRCESDRHIRIASKKIAPWRSIANMRSQE
ncbi:MAG: hypothetical protein F2634_02585, partial [Actinobacteria bacterium]|nr:hypothetical protein [Actinomycetota bacterium]